MSYPTDWKHYVRITWYYYFHYKDCINNILILPTWAIRVHCFDATGIVGCESIASQHGYQQLHVPKNWKHRSTLKRIIKKKKKIVETRRENESWRSFYRGACCLDRFGRVGLFCTRTWVPIPNSCSSDE